MKLRVQGGKDQRFFKWLEKDLQDACTSISSQIRLFAVGMYLKTSLKHYSKWGHYDLSELYYVKRLLDILETNNGGNQIKILPYLRFEGLTYLQDVGLGYLSLGRPSMTHGGETQRVNLTACLGSALTDALFALDEPTIGLHGKDVGKLVGIMKKLARAGNCVCVVEHDDRYTSRRSGYRD